MRVAEGRGRPKDTVQLEQLETALREQEWGVTATVSTSNLKWLVTTAAKWVRRKEEANE